MCIFLRGLDCGIFGFLTGKLFNHTKERNDNRHDLRILANGIYQLFMYHGPVFPIRNEKYLAANGMALTVS